MDFKHQCFVVTVVIIKVTIALFFIHSVMAAGLNEAGRGLNIAVINPKAKEVIRVGHFDTFGAGKNHWVMFLF